MDWKAVVGIQAAYLEMLDDHYLAERSAVKRNDVSASAPLLANESSLCREERLRRFLKESRDFWDQHRERLEAGLRSNDGTRICLWGDSGVDELLPRMGLYFDIVLLPDPFYTYAPHPDATRFPKDYDLSVLNWLLLVDCVRPALEPHEGNPLLVCFPQRVGLKERSEEVERIMHSAGTLAATGFQRLLKLANPPVPPQEIYDLLRRVKVGAVNTSGTLAAIERVVAPVLTSRGMPSAREKRLNPALLRRVRDRRLRDGDLQLLFTAFGSQFYLAEARHFNCSVMGADDVVTELLEPAMAARAQLLIDESTERGISEERVVAHSFQRRMPWLSRVTVEDCLRLRAHPLFSEVKDVFRIERCRLRQATSSDLEIIGAHVEENVENVLKEHELRLAGSLRELRNLTRNSSISLAAGVSLGLASLAFPGMAVLSVGGFLLGSLLGTESAYGLYRKRREKQGEVEQGMCSPISVLLRARKYSLGKEA